MVGIVVRECHQDHEDNGDNGEDDDTDGRERKEGAMEIAVDQGAEIVLIVTDVFAVFFEFLMDARLLDIQRPSVDKGDDEEDRQDAVEKDLERIVVINGLGEPSGRIFDSFRTLGAEGTDLAEPIAAGEDHIEDKGQFEA